MNEKLREKIMAAYGRYDADKRVHGPEAADAFCEAVASLLEPKRLVRDDSGHDYLIPAEKKDAFDKWVEFTEDFDAEGDWEGEAFDDCRLNRHPSSYLICGELVEE